jgi:hypothetical protein
MTLNYLAMLHRPLAGRIFYVHTREKYKFESIALILHYDLQ